MKEKVGLERYIDKNFSHIKGKTMRIRNTMLIYQHGKEIYDNAKSRNIVFQRQIPMYHIDKRYTKLRKHAMMSRNHEQALLR